MGFLGDNSANNEQNTARWPKPLDGEVSQDKLPEDWKEKLSTMQDELAKMRDEAVEIPERYNMTKQQFEEYCNNSKNFSSEQWEMMLEAKKQSQDFIDLVQGIVPSIKKSKTRKKARGQTQNRGWISVN